MSFQYPMWKLFVATAAVAALFALVPRSEEVVPTAATFVAAAALVGLILVSNRSDFATIWRSVAWTLAGACFGMALSPAPPLHPPLGFLFYGAFSGWAVGGAIGLRRRMISDKKRASCRRQEKPALSSERGKGDRHG
jgi:hypothetical protein